MPKIKLTISSCPLEDVPPIAEKIALFGGEMSVVELCAMLGEPPASIEMELTEPEVRELGDYLKSSDVEFEIQTGQSSEAFDEQPAQQPLQQDAPGGDDQQQSGEQQTRGRVLIPTGDQLGEEHSAAGLPDYSNLATAAEKIDTGAEDVLFWEDHASDNFFASLWSTWKTAVFDPERFFSTMPSRGGLVWAFVYALVASIVYTILTLPQTIAMLGDQAGALEQIMELGQYFGSGFETAVAITPATILRQTVASLAMLPIGLFYLMVFLTGTYHLVARLLGGRGEIEGTFKVAAYSMSVLVFAPIPIIGQLIIFIYGFVIAVIGFREVHSIGNGAAIIVVLAPVLALMTLFFSLAVAGALAVMA